MHNKQLEDLFFSQARRYCQETEACLNHMKAASTLPEDIEEMIHRFHWFAGAGGTCGYPKISKLGRACESICLTVKKNEATPDTRMLSAWQALLDRLRTEVETAESNKC